MRPDVPTMNLPEGKTCSDCAHLYRCTVLFNCDPTNTHCDWDPSRFREAAQRIEVEQSDA